MTVNMPPGPLKRLVLRMMLAIIAGVAPTFALLATAQEPALGPIFREVSDQSGLRFRHYNGMTGKLFLPEIMGAGGALFDFDNDGDLDIFLVQGTTLEPGDLPARTTFPWQGPGELRSRLIRNDLTVKDGRPSMQLVDVTDKSGIIAKDYGMGVATGDINNDGWTDLYLTNVGSNQMFLNKGDGTFADVTSQSGTD